MAKIKIADSVSRAFHKAGFTLKKYSPEILVGVGIVGGVASAVLACRATLKVNDIVSESKTNIDKIHTATEKGVTEAGQTYDVEDSKKDLTIVYVQTGLKLAKLYAPAVLLGAASVGCILTSHNIIHKRNVALAAAYTAVDTSFKEYRGRVVERFGKELDKELRYDIKAKEVEETVVDENGETKTVKKVVEVAHPSEYSDYARCFDDGCAGWEKDAEHNLFFLRQQQNFANDLLQKQGYLFLNDVYKMLGIPVTQAGQAVGWMYDENCPNGDNYVDFGIYDIHKEANRNFVNGYERSIWLDFNVDGPIWHLL